MRIIDDGIDCNVNRQSIALTCQILDDDMRTPLHWAASSKNSELVEFLLSIPSMKVNAQDDVLSLFFVNIQSGYTPLMCAVLAGRKDNAALLLKAGSDVNLENENKETVIHMTKGTSEWNLKPRSN